MSSSEGSAAEPMELGNKTNILRDLLEDALLGHELSELLQLNLRQEDDNPSSIVPLSTSNSQPIRLDILSNVPPEVSEKIVQYLSLEDLKNYRLVSSAWRAHSTEAFKSLGRVIFRSNRAITVKRANRKMVDFSELMREYVDSTDFPFGRFSCIMSESCNEEILNFFATFGHVIRDLTLTNRGDIFMECQLVHQLKEILQYTSCLEELKVVNLGCDHLCCENICALENLVVCPSLLNMTLHSVKALTLQGSGKPCRLLKGKLHFYDIIPRLFPMLKTLVLGGYTCNPPGFPVAFQGMECLKSFSSNKDGPRMFPQPINVQSLPDQLTMPKAKLTDLSLSLPVQLPNALTEVGHFEKVLLDQSSTLESLYLNLHIEDAQLSMMIKVPALLNLKSINVAGKFVAPEEAFMLKQSDVPVLRRVTVCCLTTLYYLFDIETSESKLEPFGSIRELVVSDQRCLNWGAFHSLKHITTVVPNLRILRIRHYEMSPPKLLLIFKYHSQLEELDVQFRPGRSEGLDDAICGFPTLQQFFSSIAIESQKSSSPFSFEDLQNTALSVGNGPRLLDMTCLRRLRLVSETRFPTVSSPFGSNPISTRISSLGVLLALLKIQPLEALILGGITAISDEYIARLKEHHVSVSICGNVYDESAGGQSSDNSIQEDIEDYSDTNTETESNDSADELDYGDPE